MNTAILEATEDISIGEYTFLKGTRLSVEKIASGWTDIKKSNVTKWRYMLTVDDEVGRLMGPASGMGNTRTRRDIGRYVDEDRLIEVDFSR